MMEKYTTVQARNKFSEIINRAAFGKQRVVLTRRGADLVAVVPIEDVQLIRELEDRRDVEDARAAIREARRKGTTKLADLKKELGL